MKVSRDLDKTREFTSGSGTYVARPGEDLIYDPKTGYQMRNVVGGGRSAGRGGATAEEMRDVEEEGITTERKMKRGDYGPTKTAPTEPMPKPVKKAAGGMTKGYAKGGSIDGCAQRGKTKGRYI
tara:strand:+ start:60 stop:431 length:372 start_codon:yes stop_codon:yes gene_type:complete